VIFLWGISDWKKARGRFQGGSGDISLLVVGGSEIAMFIL
jgi:hypothetical protein